MPVSLVPCPTCMNRRRLISIEQEAGAHIRRFRCDHCQIEMGYEVTRSGFVLSDNQPHGESPGVRKRPR